MSTGTLPKREINGIRPNDGQSGEPSGNTPSGDARPFWRKRRFLLPVTALVAFAIGLSAGGPDAALEQAQARIGQLEAQLADAEERADQAEGQARAAQEQAFAADQARALAEAELARGTEELPAAVDQPETAAPPVVLDATRLERAPSATPPPSPEAGCDPNYSPCIPAFPPDLDCDDIGHPVRVTGSDPHRLDRDNDGTGCES